MKPAQYMSAYVGVCTRSVGKLTDVGAVPSGALVSAACPASCALAATANSRIKSPVFFILPPSPPRIERHFRTAPPPTQGLSRKVTRGWGWVKVTRVLANLRQKFPSEQS